MKICNKMLFMKSKFPRSVYYLAHPFSGNEAVNFDEANIFSNMLIKEGIYVFSPLSHSVPIHKIENINYDVWMNIDKVMLLRCNGLILSGSWSNSSGCLMELDWAKNARMDIFTFDGEELKQYGVE